MPPKIKQVKSIIKCFWLGHHPEPAPCGDDYYCAYCYKEMNYDDCVNDVGFRDKLIRLKNLMFRFFLKCEDCGKRFYRHDENADHRPF